MDIYQRILTTVAATPMDFETLHGCLVDYLSPCDSIKQLSKALNRMHIKGQINRLADGSYQPGKGATAVLDGVSGETATIKLKNRRKQRDGKIPRPREWPAPSADNNGLLAHVEQLEAAAQAALDEYVYSVGDKEMLDNLMALRNQARAAKQRLQALSQEK